MSSAPVVSSGRHPRPVILDNPSLLMCFAKVNRVNLRAVIDLACPSTSSTPGPDTPSDRSQLGSTPMAWIASGSFHWPGAVELPLLLLEHPCIFRTAAIHALDAASIGVLQEIVDELLSNRRSD